MPKQLVRKIKALCFNDAPRVGGKVLADGLEIKGRADRTWPAWNAAIALVVAGHAPGSSLLKC